MGANGQERGFDQSDQLMTDPSIAQDDSAPCEHVRHTGYQGRTSVMIVERTRPNDWKVGTS